MVNLGITLEHHLLNFCNKAIKTSDFRFFKKKTGIPIQTDSRFAFEMLFREATVT